MSARWSVRLRRLVPGLVLVLWLAPQLLLAAHGHWMPHGAVSDCDICIQLSTSVPAVDNTAPLPPAAFAAAVLESRDDAVATHHDIDIACRGPPAFPASTVI